MKTTLRYCLSFLLLVACVYGKAQIVDISTGIDAYGNLIPLHHADDDWYVKLPGSFVYQQVPCGSGHVNTYLCDTATSYYVHPGVRWLSPFISCPQSPASPFSPNGYTYAVHTPDADTGYYYYRDTFMVTTCDIDSAGIYLEHLGADDQIDQVIINGNIHTFPIGVYTAIGFPNAPPSSAFTMSITGDVIPMVPNIIELRVHNVNSQVGMVAKGNVAIWGTSGAPAFSLSFNGPSLAATPGWFTEALQASRVHMVTSALIPPAARLRCLLWPH